MPSFSEMFGTTIGYGCIMAKKAQMEAEAAPSLAAQEKCHRTHKPVRCGNTLYLPPGRDGILTACAVSAPYEAVWSNLKE